MYGYNADQGTVFVVVEFVSLLLMNALVIHIAQSTLIVKYTKL